MVKDHSDSERGNPKMVVHTTAFDIPAAGHW